MRLFQSRRRKPLSQQDGNLMSDFSYSLPKPVLERPVELSRWSLPPYRKNPQVTETLPNVASEMNVPVVVVVVVAVQEEDDDSLDTTVARLINDFTSSSNTDNNQEVVTNAFKKLFVLAEDDLYPPHFANETIIVKAANGRLVPALLNYLDRSSSHQETHNQRNKTTASLALLVLNSISIPIGNKRLVALQHNGIQVLHQLLIANPECYIAAIILTNLTFAPTDLRNDIIIADSVKRFPLLTTLTYVLRLSSSTAKEYKASQQFSTLTNHHSNNEAKVAHELLSTFLSYDEITNHEMGAIHPIPARDEMLYPDTARWCLCVLHNLTQPAQDYHLVAHCLVRLGIIPQLLRFLTFQSGSTRIVTNTRAVANPLVNVSNSSNSSSSSENLFPDNLSLDVHSPENDWRLYENMNSPCRWSPQMSEDLALFIIMNIATLASTIDYLVQETNTVDVLIPILVHYDSFFDSSSSISDITNNLSQCVSVERQQTALLQCVKARMTLSYLLGSYGNFGQRKRARTDAPKLHFYNSIHHGSFLILSRVDEVHCLIELIANTLHKQSKTGPGGYLAVMFNVKYTLFGLRCLLTQLKNQEMIGTSDSVTALNTLLLKAIAIYTFKDNNDLIDSDAAEYACFSLYLLSNYGFQAPFMPTFLGCHHDQQGITSSIVAKILSAYKEKISTTLSSKHAVSQLLKRLPYLIFTGSVPSSKESVVMIDPIHFVFDKDLLNGIDMVTVHDNEVYSGTEPIIDIFHRPVYGLQLLPQQKIIGTTEHLNGISSSSSSSTTTLLPVQHGKGQQHQQQQQQCFSVARSYPNVLCTVQDIVLRDRKKMSLEPNEWILDDILIANQIAQSAAAAKYNNSGSRGDAMTNQMGDGRKMNHNTVLLYNHVWYWQDEEEEGNDTPLNQTIPPLVNVPLYHDDTRRNQIQSSQSSYVSRTTTMEQHPEKYNDSTGNKRTDDHKKNIEIRGCHTFSGWNIMGYPRVKEKLWGK